MVPMASPTGPHGAPPTLSQSEAAKACGVSVATVRRARRSGRIEGAYEDGHGELEHPDSLARCSRDARSRDTPDR